MKQWIEHTQKNGMKTVKVKRLLVLPNSGYEHFYDVKANVKDLQGCFDEPPVGLCYQNYVFIIIKVGCGFFIYRMIILFIIAVATSRNCCI